MADTKIVVVKTVKDVQFLGINGGQITATMAGGLELRETNKGVQVTSKSYPGKRIIIFNANISHIEYRDEEEAKSAAAK